MRLLMFFALALLLAFGHAARGQGNSLTPEQRRGYREATVARIPGSRSAVERYETMPYACAALSVPVATKLCADKEFLEHLPDAERFLHMVGDYRSQGADDIVLWALQPEHAKELADADNLRAYVETPKEFCLNLSDLSQKGAQLRARRLSAPEEQKPARALVAVLNEYAGFIGCGILLVAVTMMVAKRRREKQQ